MTTVDSTVLRADQTIWTADGYVTPLIAALAATLADVAVSSSGALLIAGQVVGTLDDATLAAVGVLPLNGTATITLGDLLVSASGTLAITGSVSVTLADLIAAIETEMQSTIDPDRIIEIGRRIRVAAIGIASRTVH